MYLSWLLWLLMVAIVSIETNAPNLLFSPGLQLYPFQYAL